jgi:hypothetical protein
MTLLISDNWLAKSLEVLARPVSVDPKTDPNMFRSGANGAAI